MTTTAHAMHTADNQYIRLELRLDDIVERAVGEALSDHADHHDVDELIDEDAVTAAATTTAQAAIVGASLEIELAMRSGNPPSTGIRASNAFMRGAAYAGAALEIQRQTGINLGK